MPPLRSPVYDEFNQSPAPGGSKLERSTCRHCERFSCISSNLGRKRHHLNACGMYRKYLGDNSQNSQSDSHEGPSSLQALLPFSAIPRSQQRTNELLFTEAIVASGLAFSTFDTVQHPEWQRLFQALNPSFRLPNRFKMAGELLDEVYESVQSQIQQLVRSTESLNFTFDESSAVNHDRIANLSLIIGDG